MRIVIASSNPGKLKEIAEILPAGLEAIPQSALNVPDVEETGNTFIENAIIKARNASLHSNLPAVADDSGLEVDYLGGSPGVYSARYAGPEATDVENIDKLLHQLEGVTWENRTARFHCAIALFRDAGDPRPIICEGIWEGLIQNQPTGDYGFGYDPVFHVKSHHCSAAELDAAVKNQLSHRAQALRKLKSHTDLLRTYAELL
jgi:XTP/dITP diphosphohydrolase